MSEQTTKQNNQDIHIDVGSVRQKFEQLLDDLTVKSLDKAVSKTGAQTLTGLVAATPKRWFGQVRGSWRVEAPKLATRKVVNPHKVMRFLEFGTANKGTGFITPKNKKFLYIPLNRRASFGWNKSLVYGRDYILKKKVRGIKPRYIVRNYSPTAAKSLFVNVGRQVEVAVRKLVQ